VRVEILGEEKVDSEVRVEILGEEKVDSEVRVEILGEEKVEILENLEEKVVILKEQEKIIEKEQILN
jgi:hypothetical protein